MEPKITVHVNMGSIALSFETDSAGTGLENGLESIRTLVKTHRKKLESIGNTTTQWAKVSRPAGPSAFLPSASLSSLNLKDELKDRIVDNIRQISYWDLVLLVLYHSNQPLGYAELMSISKEVGKPISYDWLNTEFHRKKYSGLVRSEEVPGQKDKLYSITEVGRKRVQSFLRELTPHL